MTLLYDIIIKPIITEKSNTQIMNNCYTFEVHPKATKVDVRKAVEKIYSVKVVKVNTATVEGKARHFGKVQGKESDWKKAIVFLAEGQKIDSFLG